MGEQRFELGASVVCGGRAADALAAAAIPLSIVMMWSMAWPLLLLPPGRSLVGWLEQRRSAAYQLRGAQKDAWRIEGDRIVLEGDGSEISRERVAHGWIEPHEGTPLVVVELRGKRRLIGRARDLEQARNILEALGIDASRQVTRLPLGSRAVERGWGVGWHAFIAYLVSILLVTPAIALGGLAAGKGVGAGVTAALMAVAAFFASRAYLRQIRRGAAIIGNDGVSIERAGSKRFVSYADVVDVREDETSTTLVLSDEEVRLPTGGVASPEPAVRAAMALRIRDALAAYRRQDAARDLPRLLERGERELSDWRAALTTIFDERRYREAAVAASDLVELVENARASAEQRIAAAIALSARKEAGSVRDRVRIAAEACANPKLRIALEAAVDGSLEEQHIEEALAADEEKLRVGQS